MICAERRIHWKRSDAASRRRLHEDPGKFKITEDAASRASIQSGAGFSRESGLIVWPLMQKRHSRASIRLSPIMILMVIRKENNNLWASKRLRHTCADRDHSAPSLMEPRRVDGVKAPPHDGTPTAHVRVDEIREENVQVLEALLHVI